MRNKNKYIITLLLSVCLLLPSCTNLDEIWYNRVTEDTFFKDEHDVLAALYRPFTHARWYEGESRWKLQEVTADQMVTTQKGQHWWNGGRIIDIFTMNGRQMMNGWDSWRGATMGIALAVIPK